MTETKNIIKALFDFQQSCPAIKKESEAKGAKFSYKYGGLPHIMEVIKPHLKKASLVVTQPIGYEDGGSFVKTIVAHSESGEVLDSYLLIPNVEFAQMNVVQSAGAVITYMRRYALMSILGLVTEDDDTDAQGTVTKQSDDKPPMGVTIFREQCILLNREPYQEKRRAHANELLKRYMISPEHRKQFQEIVNQGDIKA